MFSTPIEEASRLRKGGKRQSINQTRTASEKKIHEPVALTRRNKDKVREKEKRR